MCNCILARADRYTVHVHTRPDGSVRHSPECSVYCGPHKSAGDAIEAARDLADATGRPTITAFDSLGQWWTIEADRNYSSNTVCGRHFPGEQRASGIWSEDYRARRDHAARI